MAGINKAILVGNVGKDPELRALDNGRAVARFTIATSETYKNKMGDKVTNTERHNIVMWTPLAEIVDKYVKKGKQIYIEGKITNRSYQDKDGNNKYITEIVGQNMTLLGRKDEENDHTGNRFENNTNTLSESGIDELPF